MVLQIVLPKLDGVGDIRNADMAFPTYHKCFVYFLAISICQSQQLHNTEEKPGEQEKCSSFVLELGLSSAFCTTLVRTCPHMGHASIWYLKRRLLAASTREIRISGKH